MSEKHKHTPKQGNYATIREALESTEELLEHFAKPGTMLGDAFFFHMRDNRAALAAPARNCDVGTVGEQIARFNSFCDKRSCDKCELPSNGCRLAWAQMPYEEGGSNEEGR